MQRRQFITTSTLGASALALPSLGLGQPAAQPWPRETVKLIVPFAAGGGTDRLARMMGIKLGERMGKSFVVENRPGAGGNIGATQVVKSTDGHTLLFTTASIAVSQFLFSKPGYNFTRDLQPVAHISSSPLVLVVRENSPIQKIDDLPKAAGSKGLNYASPGIGTTSHLGGFLLAQKLKTNGTHVAYRGAGPAVNALIAGEIDFALMAAVAVLPFIKNKQLRAVAVAGTRPLPDLATVPLMGNPPLSLNLDNWQGIFAPMTMPKAQVDQLNTAINETLKANEVRNTIYADGATPAGGTPQVLRDLAKLDGARYGSIVFVAGVKPE